MGSSFWDPDAAGGAEPAPCPGFVGVWPCGEPEGTRGDFVVVGCDGDVLDMAGRKLRPKVALTFCHLRLSTLRDSVTLLKEKFLKL